MRRVLMILLFVFISVAARAELKVWNGEPNLWNDETQWTPTGVPTVNDDVLVTGGEAVLLHADGVCDSFVVTNTGFLILNHADRTLQVASNGVVNGSGAAFRVNEGHLNVGGSVTLLNGGSLVLDAVTSTATVHSLDPRDGILEWNAGTLRFTDNLWMESGNPISTLTVEAGRTLEVISKTIFGIELYLGSGGTLTLTGGDVTCDAFAKTAAGTFEFDDGTFQVNGDGFDWDGSPFVVEGPTSTNLPTLVLYDFALPMWVTLTNGIDIAPTADRQGHLLVDGYSNLDAAGTLGNGVGSHGSATVSNVSTWKASTLTVGGAGTGTLTIKDNSRVQDCSRIEVGRDSTATGIVTVAGAGSQWSGYWQAQIGIHGHAIVDVTDGGSMSFYDQIGDTEFARYSGSRAEMTLTGDNSQFGITSDAYSHTIYFGLKGHASLIVSNGATVTWDEFTRVGETSGSRGDIVVTGSQSSWTVDDDFWLGYEGTGTLQVLDGGSAHTDEAKLGEFPGGVGQVLVSGAGSYWHGGGYKSLGGEFLVGRYGTGELTVEKGGVVHSSGYNDIGQYSGSRGYVIVTDTGSLWAVSGELRIGFFQNDVTGRLTVANGGLVTVAETASLGGGGTIVLNGGTQGSGTLDINTLDLSSGDHITGDNNGILRVNAITGKPTSWTLPASLQIGSSNHSGGAHWTLDSGESLTVDDGFCIGYSKNASFTQLGGAVQSGTFTLGDQAAGHGTYTLSNGTLHVGTALVGYHGTGELAIASGTMTCGSLYVADDAGSHGTVSLADGGSLSAHDLLVGQQGQGVFTQTGGINTTRNDLYLGYWTSGNGSITLSGGTHTVSRDAYIGGNTEGSTSDGGTGQYTVSGGTLSVGGTLNIGYDGLGTLMITNTGLVRADTVTVGALAASTGNVVNIVGGTLQATNATGTGLVDVQRGTVSLNGGTVTADQMVLSSSAFLIGSGSIQGNLTNAGTISPGFSPGTISVTGDVELQSTSRLIFELSGTTRGTEFDAIDVSGNMTLGGTLVVELDGYTPGLGERFELLDWGTVSPASVFDTLDLPALPEGREWYTQDLTVDGSLLVSLPLAWLNKYGLSPTNDPFADPDDDQYSTAEEYTSDTNPTNGASYFKVDDVDSYPDPVIHFNSSTDRVYILSVCSNMLVDTWADVPGSGPRPGVGGADTFTDTNEPVEGLFYYRLGVDLP